MGGELTSAKLVSMLSLELRVVGRGRGQGRASELTCLADLGRGVEVELEVDLLSMDRKLSEVRDRVCVRVRNALMMGGEPKDVILEE